MNIYDIIGRAESLRKETALNAISPERAGGIMSDTLKYLNEFQIQSSSIGLDKIYASSDAMTADENPVSDLNGQPLKAGQLCVIVPGDSLDTEAGDVYRYDGNPGSWTKVGKIGAPSIIFYPDGTPIAKTSEGVLEFLNSLGHTIGQVVHTTEDDGTEKNYVFWGWTGEGQIILFEPLKITVRSAGKDAMTFTDRFKNIHYYDDNKQTGAIAVRVGDNSVEIRNTSGKTLGNFNPSVVTLYTPDGQKIVLQSSLYSKFLKIGNTEDALSFESSSDKVKINDKTLATEEYVEEVVGDINSILDTINGEEA